MNSVKITSHPSVYACAIAIVIAYLSGLISVPAMQGDRTTATTYVGRHFEVRDDDQPVKYVFNGPTRIASVTGSISADTRVQRLRLLPGWNLVSLAVTATDVAGRLQRDHPGAIDSIYRWNAASADYSV